MKSKLYPTLDIPEPMLINKPKNQEHLSKLLNSEEYYGTIKKDGAFYQLVKDNQGEVFLFSRTKSKKTGFFVEKSNNVPHLKEWAKTYLPKDTIIIGEIYYPNKTSKDVVSIMGCLSNKAVERQKNNPIHFYMHDMIRWNGEDYISKGNFERLIALRERILDYGEKPEWLEIAVPYETNLDKELREALAAGEEGMVFKKKTGKYSPGKRPTYNVKVKQETNEFDCVITGFVPPEKHYTGKNLDNWKYFENDIPVTKAYYFNWVSGINIAVYNGKEKLVPIGSVTSGMTDALRESMARDPNAYIGTSVTIQGMSFDKENMTIRHSRLMRLRPDKDPLECQLSDIF